MKSQVPVFYSDWLTLMERAYASLTAEEFSDLEYKIQNEISFSRRNRVKKIQKELPCGCMHPALDRGDMCPAHRRDSGI